MIPDEQICLRCLQPDCDETDPGCLLGQPLRTPHQRWYAKLKKDPVRHAAYKAKKMAIKDAWRKTTRGRKLYIAQYQKHSKARRLKRKQAKEEALNAD